MSRSFIILGLALLPTLIALIVLLFSGPRRSALLKERIGRIARSDTAASPPPDTQSLQKSRISGLVSWQRIREHSQAAMHGAPRPAFLAALGGSAIVAVTSMLSGLSLWVAGPLVAAAGGTAALVVAAQGRARYKARILAAFPDAIDLIIRAVRAGLPLSEAFNSLATELPGPLAEEFRRLTGEMAIGVSLDEALRNAAQRIDLPDFNFFTASIALQRETGGNLTETLQNLSQIIRRRKELQLKAKALTSEARTSSLVIGSLPFVASGALAVINPEYIGKLITDPRGVYILGIAGTSMITGIIVMRQLIRRSVN
jgi:tight adherence protein B